MAKSDASKPLASGCLSLFGLPFLLAGLFMTGWYFSGYLKWAGALRWVEVPCWIEKAKLKVSHDDSNTYRATAGYRYEFEGKTYRSEKVSFYDGSDNIGDFQKNAHAEISKHVPKKDGTPGRPFRCYVNPSKPSEAVLYRALRWQMQAFMAIFALTFPAVGAGLVIGGLLGIRATKRETELRLIHSEEPWKWKDAWSGGAIPEAHGLWKNAIHLYTLWSGAIILPLLSATWLSGAFHSSAWLLVIFPALWLIPLSLTLKRIRHRLAVGATRFEMNELPAWPGGTLTGHLLFQKPPPLRGSPEAILTCEKSVTKGSGDDRTTTKEKVWSHREILALDQITRDPSGFRLPLRFLIPADAPPCGTGADPSITHTWKLEFKVAGTPIHSTFDLPVFHTDQSPPISAPAVSAPVTSIVDDASLDLPAELSANRIVAQFDADGAPLSLVCPRARNRALLLSLFIFDLIWTAVAVFLIQRDAPWIFRIVWPVSAAAIWLIILWNLLHKRTVDFHPDGLVIRNQLGPVLWTRTLDKSQITGFSHDVNLTSNNNTYHRVRLENVFGKKITLADGITGTHTAAALMKRLENWRK